MPTLVSSRHAADMIPRRPGVLYPYDPGSGISLCLGSYIFIFSLGFRGLGSRHSNIVMGWEESLISDREDVALSWQSWILLWQVVMGSCGYWILHKMTSLYFQDPLHPIKFCLQFLIPMCCLKLNIAKNFNPTSIKPFFVDLETHAPN